LRGRLPAEAAGIKVEGANKWLTIIQNASKEKEEIRHELDRAGRHELSAKHDLLRGLKDVRWDGNLGL
jgi:hypothetical protein